MRTGTGLGILVAAAVLLSGCSLLLRQGADDCVPVDTGGECFAPTREGFIEHALASARAWPQLDGLAIEAGEIIEGFDAAAEQPTWIVPLRFEGRFVGASRFLPFREQVRLGEVALYQPARDAFPAPGQGERLVIFTAACGDPMPEACLFREYRWRIEPAT